MNEMPFPKPPPADPLPLEKWLRHTDRAESGREPFFRGRDDEYDTFRNAVLSLNDGVVGGGTMVFQGAPGAGKSALMGECMEAIRCHSTPKDPWVAVDIQPGDLRSPVALVKRLVETVNVENERLFRSSSGSMTIAFKKLWDMGKKPFQSLSRRGVSVMSVSVGGSSKPEKKREPNMTASEAFFEAAPLLRKFNLVVMVDEAQNTPTNEVVRDVVGCLHKPPHQIPLLTAFFGLSDTKEVLRQCGLSRFADGRLMNLEPLSHEDSASAIRGVFDAYEFKGTAEDREAWVDSLAELSQGWPQHVNSVSVAAGSVIRDNGGKVTAECLNEATDLAENYRKEYYEGRLAAGSSRSWVYQELAQAAKKRGGDLSVDEIEFITESMRSKSSQTLDDFMTNALHAGLLAPTRDLSDIYKIPIPSLGDYLRELEVSTPEEFRN